MLKKLIVIVGSGRLGSLLQKELNDRKDVDVRVLSRRRSLHSRKFDISTATDEEIIEELRGAYCVVSALQGGPDVIIHGQMKLLRAAKSLGVRRFIPSDFCQYVESIPCGLNPHIDWRREFGVLARAAAGNDIELVRLFCGTFIDNDTLEFLGIYEPKTMTFNYWGDGTAVLECTTYADAVRYIVAAAVDDRKLPGTIAVKGDCLPIRDIAMRYETGLGAGKKYLTRCLGTLEELDVLVCARQKADPANMNSWLGCTYASIINRGFGRLPHLSTDLFPSITPLVFEDAVRTGEFTTKEQ